jgi:hypothetical protein
MDTIKMPHRVVEIVKGNTARLEFCRGGKLFYSVYVGDTKYTFPIDVTDRAEVGEAIFNLEDKASIFMRYINKAIKALDGDNPDAMIRWEFIKADSSIGVAGEKL